MALISAGEIGELTRGRVVGEAARRVDRAATLENADSRALSFVASAKYVRYLRQTRAGVVLIPEGVETEVPEGTTAVIVDDAHRALRKVLIRLYPRPPVAEGTHPTSVVAPDAVLGARVSLGPHVVIDEGAVLGENVVVGANSIIGAHARIGNDVVIHDNATIYRGVVIGDRAVIHSGARVGKEGFGFVWEDGAHRKVPQVGGCVVGEDVEIGANVTIDRGSVGDTVIGAGTKIDNLVHIGHNVQLGKNVLIIAQVGISGSSTVGDHAILAGQVGVSGHLTIGDGARVGAQAGVISDVPAGETYSGYPARPHREALRAQAGMFKLPELIRRLRELESRFAARGPEGSAGGANADDE